MRTPSDVAVKQRGASSENLLGLYPTERYLTWKIDFSKSAIEASKFTTT